MKETVTTYLLWLCIACSPFLAQSQMVKSDMSLGIGASNYFGDMDSGNTVKDLLFFSPAVQLRYNMKHSDYLGTNVGLLLGRLKGDDARSEAGSRAIRNLDFFSPLYELSVMEEIHPLGNARMRKSRFSPYMYLGIAGYYFNPKAKTRDGQVYELQPLGTEGQGAEGYDEKYSRYRLSIPFGGGLRYRASEDIMMSVEITSRYTGFDYLDDLSGSYAPVDVLRANGGAPAVELSDRRAEPTYEGQRGDSGDLDYYFTFMLNFHYTFTADRRSSIKDPSL